MIVILGSLIKVIVGLLLVYVSLYLLSDQSLPAFFTCDVLPKFITDVKVGFSDKLEKLKTLQENLT